MFRGVPAGRRTSKDVVTKIQVEELAAHGHSIVELQQTPQGARCRVLTRAALVPQNHI